MASSSRAKECGICNEVYDEEGRCPRILPCAHCLCTYCISQLIQGNTKCCPFCRQDFDATSTQNLIVNTSLIDILRYVAEIEGSAVSPSKPATTSSSESLISAFRKENDEISQENFSVFQRLEGQIANSIRLNNELREKVKNELITKISDIGIIYQRKMKFLEEENERLERQLAVIKHNEKVMEGVRDRLESTTTFQETGQVMDEAGKANADIQSLIGVLTNFMAEDGKARQGIEKIVQSTEQKIKEIREVLSSEEDTGFLIPNVSALAIQDTAHGKITSESLRNMSTSVKNLVQRGKIYALQKNEGEQRFAQISICKDKLLVHCLTNNLPPPDIHVVKSNDVMKQLDPSSRLAFTTLTVVERQLNYRKGEISPYDNLQSFSGNIYFRFSKDTLRAKQFAHLCTGELGPSYKDTQIFNVTDKGTGMERVLCGDYECNNGCGGKALMPGVAQEGKEECDPSWLAGSVVRQCDSGDVTAAQFYVRLRDIRGLESDQSFGIVEEGLDFLRKASSYINNINRVFVSDCGMVLNSR